MRLLPVVIGLIALLAIVGGLARPAAPQATSVSAAHRWRSLHPRSSRWRPPPPAGAKAKRTGWDARAAAAAARRVGAGSHAARYRAPGATLLSLTRYPVVTLLLWRLPWILLFFAPTIVGWLRTRRDRSRAVSPVLIGVLNLLIGSTGIGWLLVWPLALGWWKPGIGSYGAFAPGAARPGWKEPASEPFGGSSGGGGDTGRTCPSCGGTRGKWVYPQTETGSAEWVSCSYCLGAGRVQ